MGGPLNVGIVGLGRISGAYLRTFAALPQIEVTALADLDPARAEAARAAAPGARALPVADLLAAPDVDLVLNLTVPAAHAEVAAAALAAGKHVYGEKPLALDTAQARELLAAAGELRVGCAPDTVLGTGTQTARKAVADGLIGRPVAANAVFVSPGHESWHPDPEFYYRPGGGPLLDMGPYYLSALVHLLGPVERVLGATSRSRPTRTIGSGPRAGTVFDVEVDTHVAGILVHTSGAITTLVTSFDVVASTQPRIEVHGSAGSLAVPDPNGFDGEVRLRHPGEPDWTVLPPSAGYVGAARGAGVADLAAALAEGRPHRASADLALHVLDVMQTLLAAGRSGGAREVETACEVPQPVALAQL
ncbi:Gfo/Idh/MocA family protein [Actinacidiphila guanduensis]|uniref:Predicted dehydrogenase n=1 Tax=Actinacidiphila guanduensis TaxID=310781 RepID=A0A1H0N4I1_9ACTN|nr:Gfo/Idh/MocA family oxidoreductase [Actinacidiphila guanduensis]SDO87521.1 Predicted dehydrogenase [Actinacidiphila guanduensis]